MRRIVGIYVRLPVGEVERLCAQPEILPKYDPRVALSDGRGLDLGSAWEDLGCFLDGGIQLPEHGPTVGEIPLPDTDPRAAWSYVAAQRVKVIAQALAELTPADFKRTYKTDPEETADSLPGELTGAWGNRSAVMFKKLRRLAGHYAKAARRGEAMLVRIGERM
jgi:hypothetical protein